MNYTVRSNAALTGTSTECVFTTRTARVVKECLVERRCRHSKTHVRVVQMHSRKKFTRPIPNGAERNVVL